MSKVYTYEDIKSHNILKSCWLVLFDRVYNITNFLVEHPGGIDILLENAGKDATADFFAKGHTDYARSLLEPYFIGKYDSSKDPEDFSTRPLTKSLIAKNRVVNPSELKKHLSKDDCWIIINNKVYDVSVWRNVHPGGSNLLTDLAGQDATSKFNEIHHSQKADRILQGIYVGDFKSTEGDQANDVNLKEIDEEEIAKHNKEEDCWVIVDGKVYDVTNFMAEHPGGPDIVVEHSGDSDATQAFKDQGHSQYAHKLLNNYYIGEFKGTQGAAKQKNKNSGLSFQQILILIAGILVGIILYKLIK